MIIYFVIFSCRPLRVYMELRCLKQKTNTPNDMSDGCKQNTLPTLNNILLATQLNISIHGDSVVT